MSFSNDSKVEVLLIHQQIYDTALTEGPISRMIFTLLMSLFFTYLNGIMVYTLWSKPVFKETPRYILFNHMLFNDSILHLATSLLYIFGVVYLRLFMTACAFLVFLSVTTYYNAPLNLALMSLERYVAINFPLRHAEIVTKKRIYIAIGVIWLMGLMYFIIDLLYVVVIKPKFLTSQIFCTKEKLFIKQWQVDVYKAFNAFFFVSVSVIILFTYVRILITSRSVSSNKGSAAKAHKTVLLHLIQLGLCLTSFLYGIIEGAVAMVSTNSSVFMDLRFLIYVFVLLLPRYLSPLIYGLRDDAVRPLFMYYFRCARGKNTSTVSVH
ncbi:odorant receptor 131-2-like [Neoarius graeffei]|uniref:odorant receptor 131-2-like n=1 Tax=Neoarius graeffei TaxID=443677 RepID=UPI00298D2343|nr:odorant receptor 131-2-like [Neoarius graeffei]